MSANILLIEYDQRSVTIVGQLGTDTGNGVDNLLGRRAVYTAVEKRHAPPNPFERTT